MAFNFWQILSLGAAVGCRGCAEAEPELCSWISSYLLLICVFFLLQMNLNDYQQTALWRITCLTSDPLDNDRPQTPSQICARLKCRLLSIKLLGLSFLSYPKTQSRKEICFEGLSFLRISAKLRIKMFEVQCYLFFRNEQDKTVGQITAI